MADLETAFRDLREALRHPACRAMENLADFLHHRPLRWPTPDREKPAVADADTVLTETAAAVGRPHGMTAEQVLLRVAIGGDLQHPDAPTSDCGAEDPRDGRKWCRLASEHPGEDHSNYPPQDGCRTWTAHDEACRSRGLQPFGARGELTDHG